MHSLETAYRTLKDALKAGNITTFDMDARLILQYRAHADWSELITNPNRSLDSKLQKEIKNDLQERLNGKPITKIYGKAEFWGYEFIVNEHVLDPRPDTETLISVAFEKFKSGSPKRILDLGTGSGCLLITLLKEWPESYGVAVDVSVEALAIARQNAKKHHVEDRISFVESSWLESLEENEFDLIVSNPPYIRKDVIPDLAVEVQKFDPILALDGGHDGLDDYKKILFQINNKIKTPFELLFEIGFDQENDLMRLVEESRFLLNAVHRDLQGNPRVVDISSGDK